MEQRVARGIEDIASGAEAAGSAPKIRRLHNIRWSYTITSWLGLVPFLLFCLLFQLLPAVAVIQNSFIDSNTGGVTLSNYQHAFFDQKNPSYIHAFQGSISISLVS